MQRAMGSEILKVVNVELPDVLTAEAHTSSAIDTQMAVGGLLLVDLGVAEAGATVDVVVQHCATSDGSYATLFTATQLTQAGDDDEMIYYLDIDFQNPNINRYLKVVTTVGTDVTDGAVLLILFGHRREAVSQPDDVAALAGSWATGIVPS